MVINQTSKLGNLADYFLLVKKLGILEFWILKKMSSDMPWYGTPQHTSNPQFTKYVGIFWINRKFSVIMIFLPRKDPTVFIVKEALAWFMNGPVTQGPVPAKVYIQYIYAHINNRAGHITLSNRSFAHCSWATVDFRSNYIKWARSGEWTEKSPFWAVFSRAI